MPLVNMKPLLRDAMDNGYAVAAFNLVDYGTTKAMVQAAEELNAPVICQTSTKTIQYWSHREIVSWVRTVAEDSPVPVVLHLDHCKDLAMIEACARAGWTSIMIDASHLPFEENLEQSKKVREIAEKYGVGMEAELGQIMGVEDDMHVAEDDSVLTDPEDARRFCDALDLSAFACAVGTAHGFYHGEPKVDFERIAESLGVLRIGQDRVLFGDVHVVLDAHDLAELGLHPDAVLLGDLAHLERHREVFIERQLRGVDHERGPARPGAGLDHREVLAVVEVEHDRDR